jgi:hypothetical protein
MIQTPLFRGYNEKRKPVYLCRKRFSISWEKLSTCFVLAMLISGCHKSDKMITLQYGKKVK